jgi:dynein heavy chain
MNITNMTLMACMSPPGGGRAVVTPRLLRHFNIISIAAPDVTNMQRIYNTIVEWNLRKLYGPYINQTLLQSYTAAVESIIDLYNQMKDGLKPTPTKSWYFLNMRDISRCVQGMTLLTSNTEINADPRKIARLWLHESARTFFDRLHESDHE